MLNVTYISYQIEQRGGLLFLRIMLDVLQYNSDETTQCLVNVVKVLKNTESNGGNFDTVASLINRLVGRPHNLLDANGKILLPDYSADYLLGLFKTTSVTKFNAPFAH